MSRQEGNRFIVEIEPHAECEECGATAELRPYGKDGARVCFACASKDPEETARQMKMILDRVDVVEVPADVMGRVRPS